MPSIYLSRNYLLKLVASYGLVVEGDELRGELMEAFDYLRAAGRTPSDEGW